METEDIKLKSPKTLKVLIVIGVLVLLIISRSDTEHSIRLITILWIVPFLVHVLRTKQSWETKLRNASSLVILWFVIIILVPLASNRDVSLSSQAVIPKETPVIQKISEEKIVPEAEIKKVIQRTIQGKNNMGFPYEEAITISKNNGGKFDISVSYNADDNISNGLIKIGVQTKTAEIMTTLYTSRTDIGTVKVTSIFPLQDKYGNTVRGDIYIAEISFPEAVKVNWNLDLSTLAQTILPRVYKTSYPNNFF